jgi:ABC-type Fe3+ transport system permease subunit
LTLEGALEFALLFIPIWWSWLYFDHLEHSRLTNAGSRLGVWVYSHYPFLLGITAYGVLGTKVFAAARGEPLDDHKRLLFTIALALALLAYAAIEWSVKENDEPLSRQTQPWLRIVGAAVLLALAFFGGSLNVGVLVTVVAVVFLVQVGLGVYKRLQRPAQQASESVTPA